MSPSEGTGAWNQPWLVGARMPGHLLAHLQYVGARSLLWLVEAWIREHLLARLSRVGEPVLIEASTANAAAMDGELVGLMPWPSTGRFPSRPLGISARSGNRLDLGP